jgi:hypothetical protein
MATLDENARRFQLLREDFNRMGAQFLRTGLDAIQSLIDAGNAISNPQHRDRSYQGAAAGYRSAARTLPRVILSGAEREKIHARLRSIRTLLRSRGVTVEDVTAV